MKNLTTLLLILVLSTGAMAKSTGKFLKYNQVTDKEILLESTKGYKVLITAYDNNSIGIKYFEKEEKAELVSPSTILKHNNLSGSIYIEELDELMQITTTSNDGLTIKIDKKHFGLTFIDKTDESELIFEEGLQAGIVTNKHALCFVHNTVGNSKATANPKM